MLVQPAEVCCLRALAFVSGAEFPVNPLPAMLHNLKPLALRNITFTTIIIIWSRAGGPHPQRQPPSPSLPRRVAVRLVPPAALLEAAPKPVRVRLSRIGRKLATLNISTI